MSDFGTPLTFSTVNSTSSLPSFLPKCIFVQLNSFHVARILFFLFLSTPLVAQTDSLRYDKWIGWITPLSIYHRYHSAIEIGAEYNPHHQLAYTLSYGLKVSDERSDLFSNQDQQYLRLGIKKYLGQKQTAGYVMGELGLFHISHNGSTVYWGDSKSPEVYYAQAKFHDYLLKQGVIFGAKVHIGELRFDFFSGLGLRLGSSRYRVLEISDRTEKYHSRDYNSTYMVDQAAYLTAPKGWRSIKPSPYMSFGFRFGIGLKTAPAPDSRQN